LLASLHGAGLSRLGRGLPDPRTERLALRALGLPAPPDPLDDGHGLCISAAPELPAARGRAADWVRARLHRPVRLALLRPRHRPGIRPPVARRRGASPMRRLALVAFVVLALPAQAFAHANLDSTSPRYQKRLQAAPRGVVLKFDQSVKAEPNAIQVKNRFGKTLSGTARANGQTVTVPARHPARRPHTARHHPVAAV